MPYELTPENDPHLRGNTSGESSVVSNDQSLKAVGVNEEDFVTRPRRFPSSIRNASISSMIEALPPLDGPPPPASDEFAGIVNRNNPTPQEFLFAIIDNVPEGLPTTWKEIIESNEKTVHQGDFKYLSDGAIPGSNEAAQSILKSFEFDKPGSRLLGYDPNNLPVEDSDNTH